MSGHIEDAATVLTHLLTDATYLAATCHRIATHITEADPETLRQLALTHPDLMDTLIRMTHNLEQNMCYRGAEGAPT